MVEGKRKELLSAVPERILEREESRGHKGTEETLVQNLPTEESEREWEGGEEHSAHEEATKA